MSMLLKVCSNVKSEINLVLTLLHTVNRSCKGLAKQNCSSFQNAAVEGFLALLSVLTVTQLATENNNHCPAKKALLHKDLDKLFSATKQRDPDNGTAKAWEEFAYPRDCKCITKSSIWLKSLHTDLSTAIVSQINERKFTGNTGSQPFPHQQGFKTPTVVLLHFEKRYLQVRVASRVFSGLQRQ